MLFLSNPAHAPPPAESIRDQRGTEEALLPTMKKTRKKGTKKTAAPKAAEAEKAQDTPVAETAPEEAEAEAAPVEPPQAQYEALLQEANDKLLRAKAELDNYRKRTQREFADIRTTTKALTVQEFLTVLDHFQMALDHAEQDTDGASLKQGMDLIHSEFKRTLENLGVTAVKTLGEPFDPTLHEALAQEPSDTVPEGAIVREWKAGYRVGERLVRPAAVVVSSGPAEEATDTEDTAENAQ